MSALSAVWRKSSGESTSVDCKAMLAVQRALGPTDQNITRTEDIAMGRCLNATLPADQFDHQPLAGGGGRFLLVADIRLDNRAELTDSLGLDRGRAAGMADSEIALLAWERWKLDSFNRLLGDWAIIAWDRQDQTLTLARDPTGMRPLHFYRGRGLVAASTMPRGLHALGDIPKAVDREFMAGGLAMAERAADHCCYRGIRRVIPGHFVRIDADRCRTDRFWHPPEKKLQLASHGDYADAVREVFDRAVQSRLRRTGKLATQLSGGLDSSAVTDSVARQLAGHNSVTAYTSRPRAHFAEQAGEPEGRFADEWDWARELAIVHDNIDHVSIRPASRSIPDGLDCFSRLVDRPVIAPGNLPWIIALNDRARADGHSVMLTGQTGNLTFSHAGKFLYAQRLRRLELPSLWRDLTFLQKGHAASNLRRAAKMVLPSRLQTLIDRIRHGSRVHGTLASVTRSRSATARLQGIDRRTEMMRFFERMEHGAVMKAHLAGWGLEYRDPTADLRLIELCIAIPEEQFLYRGQPRALARTMLAGRIPDRIRLEKRRGLQGADWYEMIDEEKERIAGSLLQIQDDPLLGRLFDVAELLDDMEQLPRIDGTSPRSLARYHTGIFRALSYASFVDQARLP